MGILLHLFICVAPLAGAVLADVPHSTDAAAYDAGALGTTPNQTFRSSPVIAPVFQINRLEGDALDLAPYLFMDWIYEDTNTPMIFRSDDLSLVYAGPRADHVSNVRSQKIGGTQYLTFWEGGFGIDASHGRAAVLDETYRLKYNITALGFSSDGLVNLHEFQFTDEGTAIISIYERRPYDLTFMGGDADGVLIDSLFQEIDPETDEAVFTWRASDHWRPEDIPEVLPVDKLIDALDFYHINSIAKVSSLLSETPGERR